MREHYAQSRRPLHCHDWERQTRFGTDGSSHQSESQDGGDPVPGIEKLTVGAQDEMAQLINNVGGRVDNATG
jgi:hypothetical protein